MATAETTINEYDPARQEPIIFTDNAVNKVKELIVEEGNPALKLRVFITGGGCSGFQYGFTFEETISPDDTVIRKQPQATAEENDEDGDSGTSISEICLLVDPMSLQYLMGAEIDYKEDLQGAQFIIRNPNAQTTCGCGASFSA